MKIFRVDCEVYDKCWYVRTSDDAKAIKLVTEMTEERGWHLDFPEEPRDWECVEAFTKEDVVIESRDL